MDKRCRLAESRAASGPCQGTCLWLWLRQIDIRAGGQVRSHQLKMGRKVIEERRRRKEGEGEDEIQNREPSGAGMEQAQLPGKWGTQRRKPEEGLETVGFA